MNQDTTKRYIPLSQRNQIPSAYSGGTGSVDDIMKGLSHVESGGDYGALGVVSPKTGDRAYGKYQFMGQYIPDWTQQYLGKKLTPDQLLADPQAQETLMRNRVQDLYNQYGNADDVASVHFTGRPVAKAGLSVQDYTGTSNASYLKKFHEGMGIKKYIPLAVRTGASMALQGGNNMVEGASKLFRDFMGGEAEEKYIGINDPSKQQTIAFKTPNIDPTGMVGLTEKVGAKAVEPIFKGFSDISTKLLERFKGRGMVSREEIMNATNWPDLKQPERDLIRRVLGDEAQAPSRLDVLNDKISAGKASGKENRSDLGDLAYLNPDEIDEYTRLNADASRASNLASGGQEGARQRVFINQQREAGNIMGQNPVFTTMSIDELKDLGVKLNKTNADTDRALGSLKSGEMPPIILRRNAQGELWLVDGSNRLSALRNQKNIDIPVVIDELGKAKSSDQISVPDFANKVKSELLPLERKSAAAQLPSMPSRDGSFRYENINLPDELRGPVANYSEHIYASPIKTSAGNVHYMANNNADNYFAHSRIEDLPDKQTRRVIEAQSDLFQKGRLENEGLTRNDATGPRLLEVASDAEKARWNELSVKNRTNPGALTDADKKEWDVLGNNLYERARTDSRKDLVKLEPYRNTWHERVIREEVKQAAKDGKTKLQFPTGETAMKIEGLGGENPVWFTNIQGRRYPMKNEADFLPENSKDWTGMEIYRDDGTGTWIITDVLGDGKFKAVPKKSWDEYNEIRNSGIKSLNEFEEALGSKTRTSEETLKAQLESRTEQFDISGKVDTENPIYKFYEKTVQKYLTNKYGGKVITDPQGVKWIEVDVKPEYKGLPVEAFGVGMLPFFGYQQEETSNK